MKRFNLNIIIEFQTVHFGQRTSSTIDRNGRGNDYTYQVLYVILFRNVSSQVSSYHIIGSGDHQC